MTATILKSSDKNILVVQMYNKTLVVFTVWLQSGLAHVNYNVYQSTNSTISYVYLMRLLCKLLSIEAILWYVNKQSNDQSNNIDQQ